jgi:hypothetical protein
VPTAPPEDGVGSGGMIQSPALPCGPFEAGAVDVVGALVGAVGGVVADEAPTPADAVSTADAAMIPAV